MPARARVFTYGPVEVDEEDGSVRCHYFLDDRPLSETVWVPAGGRWSDAAREAARLVHLLTGVSYYKAGAPPRIDLGQVTVRPGERDFLREFYLEGLGEFSFRNGLFLEDLEITGGREEPVSVSAGADPDRPLVPFGGGIDSIVTVETVRRVFPDSALFVANRRGVAPYAAIERSAGATGLPVVRAERQLDPWVLAPDVPVFNGHVPVTGVLSAIAVLCATLTGRGRVVMSNEWSASAGNVEAGGRQVNHQWSKSERFERRFRDVLNGALTPAVDYFSLLRPFSELWVARRFSSLTEYHGVVHSCNRAFFLDPAKRLDYWCGECDKCCFIDLILSPYMSRTSLEAIFGGREPLGDIGLLQRFRPLLGLGENFKPFECVGDVGECRSAATVAAERDDRASNAVLAALLGELGPARAKIARDNAPRLLEPLGPSFAPPPLMAASA